MFFTFQRGDSLDTIFASSPPESDHHHRECRVKTKTKKRTSPRRRRREFEQQQQESTDQEIVSHDDIRMPLPRRSASMMIDDVTGNITHLSDSVILDIEDSSNASSNESHTDDDLDEAREIDEGKFPTTTKNHRNSSCAIN